MPTSEFSTKVYEIVRRIPHGKVITYGQIALLLGLPRAAQAVGWSLHWVQGGPEETPCQRVVNRFGGMAAGYGWGGQHEQRADLEAEGIVVRDDFTVDLAVYQWWPTPADIEALRLSPEALEDLNRKLAFSREQLSHAKTKKAKTQG